MKPGLFESVRKTGAAESPRPVDPEVARVLREADDDEIDRAGHAGRKQGDAP